MTKRILVIDDEDSVREIVQISLESVAGWDILTASSGNEGIEIAESEQPDAILLDVMMPYMDGPTTLKKLQASVATCKIPTIMLTAKAQSSEQKQFMDLGVAGVITKPCLPLDLVDNICKILNWSSVK
ncbi:response regulator [Nostoc spongiaeforme FACHB-130]|uniref:Response regulator n=1 Tax=Nostoc spongiaeforme FACHB-130 TaxID=1357510 RepID=A0ABR8FTV7_9NOSO|nr:response regulator [Nostoc spongiaeforme]MBD2594579.1 response regulator [Nostoc spongiaeforme FACHB-130]